MADDPSKQEISAPGPAPGARRAFFKGDAARTAVKLAIASLVVGGVLAFLGLSPVAFWRGVLESFRNILSFIGDSASEIVINLATYLFFGALIVVPVWAVIRLLSNRRPRN
ncbi:MAG: DUF6460 domain-containing protein [Parvularculaceae bacterium]